MTDFNLSPEALPDFPERPSGSDRIEIRIVADRPDPADDQSAIDIGLAMLGSGLPQDILDKFQGLGVPRDEIYVQTTYTDTESAPVVRLGDVIPEEPPAEEPTDPEPEAETPEG